MCFLTCEDRTGTADCVVFPNLYPDVRPKLKRQATLWIRGKITQKEERVSVRCESILTTEEIRQLFPQSRLCFKLPSTARDAFQKNCCTLCEISRESSGLLLPDGSETHSFPKSFMHACPDGNSRCSSLPHHSSRANRSAAATCWKKQVMETQVFSLERRRFSGISGYIFSKTC